MEVSLNSGQLKGRKWYIPHHCVTSKFQVVFDAVAQFQQTSLNDQIFPGPDLTNNLVGLLTRFRKYLLAVAGDAKAMFLQVLVVLRFLW